MTERDTTDREEPVLVRNIEHLAMRAASQGMHHETERSKPHMSNQTPRNITHNPLDKYMHLVP